MKSHLTGIKNIVYCYVLAICLGWASIPVLLFLTFIIPLEVSQSIYTIFSSIILCALLYITMHENGTRDIRPVKGSRYVTKGFVCGLVAFLIIYLLEVLFILLADRYVLVQHPFLDIKNINGYFRLFLYMPFYWLYKLLNPASGVVPKVNYITAIIPVLFVSGASGFGYYMGFTGKKLINKEFNFSLKNIIYKEKK